MALLIQLSAKAQHSLESVLKAAGKTSFDIRQAGIQVDQAVYDLQIGKSLSKPAVSLQAQLPDYFRATAAITQPNGTIAFQQIQQNNAYLGITASKRFEATETRLSLETTLTRFDDFSFDNKLYNGMPLRLSIEQPLFAFKNLAWTRKIQQAQLKESQGGFQMATEATYVNTVSLYFAVLLAEENRRIASANVATNEELIEISKERLSLGKISKEAHLQLAIQLENARINLGTSIAEKQTAEDRLWLFIGQSQEVSDVQYAIPDPLDHIKIDLPDAINKAKANLAPLLSFKTQVLQAQRDKSKSKREMGIQGSLLASLGLARGSDRLNEVYQEPFSQQQLQFVLRVPLLDGGRKRNTWRQQELRIAAIKEAEENEQQSLINATRISLRNFQQQQGRISELQNIRKMAQERLEIARERFLLGKLSVTEWTIAQRETDNTKRDYLQALAQYWTSYYQLRMLTGFDYATGKEIKHQKNSKSL